MLSCKSYSIDYEYDFKYYKNKDELQNNIAKLLNCIAIDYKLYYIDNKKVEKIIYLLNLKFDKIENLFFKSINDYNSDVWLLISKKGFHEVKSIIDKLYNNGKYYYLNFFIEESICVFTMYDSDGLEFIVIEDSIEEKKLKESFIQNNIEIA